VSVFFGERLWSRESRESQWAEKLFVWRQSPSAAKQFAERPGFRCPAPKGAYGFEELTASLKRCPDTKLEFFSKLFGPTSRQQFVHVKTNSTLLQTTLRADFALPFAENEV